MKGVDAVEIPATLVRRISHEGRLKNMGTTSTISAKGESEKSAKFNDVSSFVDSVAYYVIM